MLICCASPELRARLDLAAMRHWTVRCPAKGPKFVLDLIATCDLVTSLAQSMLWPRAMGELVDHLALDFRCGVGQYPGAEVVSTFFPRWRISRPAAGRSRSFVAGLRLTTLPPLPTRVNELMAGVASIGLFLPLESNGFRALSPALRRKAIGCPSAKQLHQTWTRIAKMRPLAARAHEVISAFYHFQRLVCSA